MTKTKAKSATPERLLTETELELMTILWRLGEGSVADVIEQLPPERELAYTSVSTILRILEQKHVLQTRKEGRGHIYIPAIQKSNYEARTVKHIVNRVFAGTPVALIRQLVEVVPMNACEMEEIQKIINAAAKKK